MAGVARHIVAQYRVPGGRVEDFDGYSGQQFMDFGPRWGSLRRVEYGDGEALVTTAAGLLVAIPAVMVFNYFTNAIDSFVVDMDETSSELISYMLREGRKN